MRIPGIVAVGLFSWFGYFCDGRVIIKSTADLDDINYPTGQYQTTVTKASRNRKRRYVTNKHKWRYLKLTWSFRDPHQLFKGKRKEFRIVKSLIATALEKWSIASNRRLIFQDIQMTVPHLSRDPRIRGDLDILFARYDHGDKEPFDGRGGIVAHSGYPMEGIVHFDGSESWSINGRRGIDLRFVALHEIGHALGLRHSDDPEAIMHPYYRNNSVNDFKLSNDDVSGIRALYDDDKVERKLE